MSVSGDGGSSHLALFLPGENKERRGRVVALRMSGQDFIAFAHQLEVVYVPRSDGTRLTREDLVDHRTCLSYYFKDPDENELEVVCYEYAKVKEALMLGKIES